MVSVVFFTSVVLYYYEKNNLFAEVEEKMELTLKHYVRMAEESLLAKDDLLLLNYTNLIKKTDPSVLYAGFYDKSGMFIAHTDATLLYKHSSPLRHSTNPDVLVKKKEVVIGKKVLGNCEVGFSRDYVNKHVSESLARTRRRIYFVGMGGVLMGIVGSLLLSRALTVPIHKLVVGAQKIGSGDLSHKMDFQRKDEIGILADEFNKMGDKLKELDDMKRDFVASITHELRSPLGAIQSYISLMLEKRDFSQEVMEDNLLRMKKNTLRLARFINDLLDVAKIEAGKLDIMPTKVNVISAITDVVDLFKASASEKKITMEVKIEPLTQSLSEPSDLYVRADDDRFRQVVTNLVNNALKFTPDGGKITVRVNSEQQIANREGANQMTTQSLNRSIAQSPYVVVSVSDTGIGIPADSLERIFSKFEQVKADRDRTKGPKGTGLGLAIAKAIVELHGGKIWVESTVGIGTTFYFTIPVWRE